MIPFSFYSTLICSNFVCVYENKDILIDYFQLINITNIHREENEEKLNKPEIKLSILNG